MDSRFPEGSGSSLEVSQAGVLFTDPGLTEAVGLDGL